MRENRVESVWTWPCCKSVASTKCLRRFWRSHCTLKGGQWKINGRLDPNHGGGFLFVCKVKLYHALHSTVNLFGLCGFGVWGSVIGFGWTHSARRKHVCGLGSFRRLVEVHLRVKEIKFFSWKWDYFLFIVLIWFVLFDLFILLLIAILLKRDIFQFIILSHTNYSATPSVYHLFFLWDRF